MTNIFRVIAVLGAESQMVHADDQFSEDNVIRGIHRTALVHFEADYAPSSNLPSYFADRPVVSLKASLPVTAAAISRSRGLKYSLRKFREYFSDEDCF